MSSDRVPPPRSAGEPDGEAALFEDAPVGLVQLDEEGRLTRANGAWCQLSGWRLEDVSGEGWARIVHPKDRARLVSEWSACLRRGRPLRAICRFVRPDGAILHVLLNTVPRPGRDGASGGWIGAVTDIGDRLRLERERSDNEERYRRLVDSSLDALIGLDERGLVVEWSPTAERLFGWSRAEALDRSLSELVVPPEQRQRHEEGLRRLVRSGVPAIAGRHVELEAMDRTGRRFPVELSIATIRLADRQLFAGFVRDISARRLAEAERAQRLDAEQRARREVQAALARLVDLQEAERREVARELHDQVGQLLTGLKLMLERWDGGPADAAPALEIVDDVIARVRSLSMDLRPPMLDELGLLPALHWNISRFQARTGVVVEVRQRGVDRRLPPPVELAAFRIVQEALTNVARHAGAAAARVTLWADEALLSLEVADRGRGFDLAARPLTSIGLAGMRERAFMVGGELTLDSTPGEGTLVRADLPLAGSRPEPAVED